VGIPVMEQVKVQAQVLVPLIKAFQAELGEERANALVRRALGDLYRRLGEQWWRARESSDVRENVALAFASFAKGDAVDYSVRAQSQDTYEIDVTGCRYAKFYKELGEAELGFLLVCSSDFPFADGFGADIKLTRTQTIMQVPATAIFATGRRKTDKRIGSGAAQGMHVRGTSLVPRIAAEASVAEVERVRAIAA